MNAQDVRINFLIYCGLWCLLLLVMLGLAIVGVSRREEVLIHGGCQPDRLAADQIESCVAKAATQHRISPALLSELIRNEKAQAQVGRIPCSILPMAPRELRICGLYSSITGKLRRHITDDQCLACAAWHLHRLRKRLASDEETARAWQSQLDYE